MPQSDFPSTTESLLNEMGWEASAFILLRRLDEICEALEKAFPHFQEGAPITAEAILGIGREYQEMVMGWAPFRTGIEFVDCVGHPGKLTFEDDVWGYDGVLLI